MNDDYEEFCDTKVNSEYKETEEKTQIVSSEQSTNNTRNKKITEKTEKTRKQHKKKLKTKKKKLKEVYQKIIQGGWVGNRLIINELNFAFSFLEEINHNLGFKI